MKSGKKREEKKQKEPEDVISMIDGVVFRLEDLLEKEILGAGAFGTVQKWLHKPTGKFVAMKVSPNNATLFSFLTS